MNLWVYNALQQVQLLSTASFTINGSAPGAREGCQEHCHEHFREPATRPTEPPPHNQSHMLQAMIIPQIGPVVVTTNDKVGIKLGAALVRLSVAASQEHTDTYIAWQVAQPLSRSARPNVHWKGETSILLTIGARNYC